MKNKINRWITVSSLVLWFISYGIIMSVLWASTFTFNEVMEARENRKQIEQEEIWKTTDPSEIWGYSRISTRTWEDFKVGDELQFRSFNYVNWKDPIKVNWLDKLICKGWYESTFQDEWFMTPPWSDWSTYWTFWGRWNVTTEAREDCHIVACQFVDWHWHHKTQCITSDYFNINE